MKSNFEDRIPFKIRHSVPFGRHCDGVWVILGKQVYISASPRLCGKMYFLFRSLNSVLTLN